MTDGNQPINYSRARKERARSLGLCTQCCTKKARPNRVTCSVCAEQQRQYAETHKAQKSAYYKERRNAFRSKGLCVDCGQRQSDRGTRCTECFEKYRDVRNEGQKRRTQAAKERVYAGYGGKCVCCGEDNPLFLNIDHVNNDGAHHRRVNKLSAGYALYLWIERNNFPDTLQLLCANCNQGKRLNDGICPHQEESSYEVKVA